MPTIRWSAAPTGRRIGRAPSNRRGLAHGGGVSAATTRLGVAVALAGAGFGLGFWLGPRHHEGAAPAKTIAVRPLVRAPAEGALVPVLVSRSHSAQAVQQTPQPAPSPRPQATTTSSGAAVSANTNRTPPPTRRSTGTSTNPTPFTPLTDTSGSASP